MIRAVAAARVYKTVKAGVTTIGGASRYSAKIVLPRGSWRFVAVAPADALHTTGTSSYSKTLVVK
ncbi:MAG: hypothetical protein FDZ75_03825 [Actinobacteria bacterium]|nr:MAG: hypothetical protein FDZ75_03825 [Actinomycetota bacterium]